MERPAGVHIFLWIITRVGQRVGEGRLASWRSRGSDPPPLAASSGDAARG